MLNDILIRGGVITMKIRSGKRVAAAMTFVLLALAPTSPCAQPPGAMQGMQQQPGGAPGAMSSFGPSQMQELMRTRIKETLKAPDKEWIVIEPLLTKIMDLRQQEAMPGGPGGQTGQSGQGGPQFEQSAEAQSRQTVLDSETTGNDGVRDALDAYCAVPKTREAKLATAREQLRSVLTIRQEARLVMMGLLD